MTPLFAQTWLARLLGAEGLEPGAETRVELTWENLPSSWGVFVLLAAIIGIAWFVLWLYRREIVPEAPRGEKWLRRLLAFLRLGALLGLLLIFLAPAW